MTDQMISPEDRERLAKTKFGEWFNELFDKKITELAAFSPPTGQQGQGQGQPTGHPQPPQGQPPQQQQQPHTGRRRSLLEECLSQTFGF